jgi:hypothetical protein
MVRYRCCSTWILKPTQKKNSKSNISFGPFPADGFGSAHEIDAVIATHDQGLVPLRRYHLGGVNFTADWIKSEPPDREQRLILPERIWQITTLKRQSILQ